MSIATTTTALSSTTSNSSARVAHFDCLVDSIVSGRFNHNCYVVEKAVVCNPEDILVITYEANPHNIEGRKKRSYTYKKRKPAKKRKTSNEKAQSESVNEQSSEAAVGPPLPRRSRRHTK